MVRNRSKRKMPLGCTGMVKVKETLPSTGLFLPKCLESRVIADRFDPFMVKLRLILLWILSSGLGSVGVPIFQH